MYCNFTITGKKDILIPPNCCFYIFWGCLSLIRGVSPPPFPPVIPWDCLDMGLCKGHKGHTFFIIHIINLIFFSFWQPRYASWQGSSGHRTSREGSLHLHLGHVCFADGVHPERHAHTRGGVSVLWLRWTGELSIQFDQSLLEAVHEVDWNVITTSDASVQSDIHRVPCAATSLRWTWCKKHCVCLGLEERQSSGCSNWTLRQGRQAGGAFCFAVWPLRMLKWQVSSMPNVSELIIFPHRWRTKKLSSWSF